MKRNRMIFFKNRFVSKSYLQSSLWRCSANALLLFLFIITLFSQPCLGQITSRQDNKTLFKADNAFEYGDYLNALNLYQKLYPLDSTNAELNFKMGICNYEIKKFRSLSKKYFDKVPPTTFPEVSYYLGKLNHLIRDYEKSIFCFNQYKRYKGDKEHSPSEIDNLIEKCNTAMLFESTAGKTVQIKNLGSGVNTEYAEYAPLIPADENFILFTSRRKNDLFPKLDPLGEYFEDIYISKKVGDEWQAPVILDTNVNTAVHDASTGLSADGERMLIYRTSKDLRTGDIYESHLMDDNWAKPEMLGTNVNSPFLETSACFNHKGDVIYFSSNRPGGYGGLDLYRAKRLPNGSWGAPYNLGPNINTEYNEDSPYSHPVGDVFYFSSEGHKNMGGYDIFKSNIDESGNLGEAKNLGYPINTVDDDIFFVMNTDGSKGYLSSGREGGFGSQDIYVVNLTENVVPLDVYNIYVTGENSSVLKKVELELTDIKKKEIYGTYKSNEFTGKILVISEPKKEYQITIKVEGYEPFVTTSVFDSNKELMFQLLNKIK
jgi:tetratricopeptide (TPR) repeat protein